MKEKTWYCSNCKMTITLTNTIGRPDPKHGGECPKNSKGEHYWRSK